MSTAESYTVIEQHQYFTSFFKVIPSIACSQIGPLCILRKRHFKVFRGRALHTRDLPNYRGGSKPIRIESTGDCLILFFPDEKA